MRIMIKKSVADEICRYWGLPLVKSVKTRRQEFLEIKRELLAHIRKLRKQEEAEVKKASWELEQSFALEKATGKKREKADNGTVRTWGNGKKYKRIAPGKWVQVFNDDRTRGAQQSLRYIEKKIASINDELELMKFVQNNKEKFVDNWGYPLPAVERLSELAHKRNEEIVAGKEGTNIQARIREEEIEKVVKNVHRRLASMAASVGIPGGKPIYCGKTSKGEDMYTWASSRKNQAEVYAITSPGHLSIIENDHPRFNEIRRAVKDYVPNENDREGHFEDVTQRHSANDKIAKKDEVAQVAEHNAPSAQEKAADQFEKTRQSLSDKILGTVNVSDGMTRELLSLYGDFAKGSKARRKKLFDEIFNTHLTPSFYNRIQNGWTEERIENTVGKGVLKDAKKYKAELAEAALKNDADYMKHGETSDYYRRSIDTLNEINRYKKERQYLFDGCYKATRKLFNAYKDYRDQSGDDSEDLFTDLKRLVRRCNNSDSFNNSELHKMLIQDRPDLVLNHHSGFSSKEIDAARERAKAIIAELKA